MPNDLYLWEGGLEHHCPECHKPLTTPQARERCLGVHAEPCKQYHTLFKMGGSRKCNPCKRSDEERLKRLREIVQLLHDIKQIKGLEQTQPGASPLTPKVVNMVNNHHVPPEDGAMSKKERKAAKKAKTFAEMPKPAVSVAEMDFVGKVLHPNISEAEHDLESQLPDDPETKLNRAFHPGTSNRREIRNEFVKKDKHVSSDADYYIDPETFNGLLQLLNVSPLTSGASAEEKDIHAKLKVCIESDLVTVKNEAEQIMMRKAGFWRWASNKAYKRLVMNGRIRVQKGSSTATVMTESSTTSSAIAGADENETDDTTEPDTDVTTLAEEDGDVETKFDVFMPATPEIAKANDNNKEEDDKEDYKDDDGSGGWTTVGKPKAAKPPIGKIKLKHNGGLVKMTSPVTPVRPRPGFATSYEHLY